ncbi:MAG TPA: RluA family pseudouridine synthase [Bacteroidales bacterium]|nr:RluA family pseudouridine synthase [Bacteroidales bacterium]
MSDFPELPEEETDLYEHHRLVVDKGQSLLRIDKFLMGRLENVTRNRLQNATHAGNILVNGKAVKPNYKVKPGDIITIVLAQPPREFELIPENIPFNLVYEDNDLLVVNKDAGMVVHPGYANFTGTLVNALLYYFQQKNYGEGTYPLLVHRIDKDTSGILLVAKNELAQARLARNFFDHTIERKYVALVWGDIENDQGTVEGNIGRSAKDRRVMYVYPGGEYGKPAITHYTVLKRFGYVTLVECRLETGRTHQIRAHLRYIGHPLFNDKKYGGDQILKGTTFSKYRQFIQNCFTLMPRQALHARSLGFNHPIKGNYMHFESELPEDMKAVLEKWEHYATSSL